MMFEYLNGIVLEILDNVNYVLIVFIAEISALFMYQWYSRRKEELHNRMILAYGLYFLFFAVGMGFTISVTTPLLSTIVSDFLFTLGLILRGVGGIVFAAIMEYSIQKIQRTWYILTITLSSIVIITPFLYYTSFFTYFLNCINLGLLILPCIFTIYFIRNTYGEIKRKLIIALTGFIIFCIALYLISPQISFMISNIFNYPALTIFSAQILVVCGSCLIMYGFYGYSFFLEYQWRENLISLHIINKTEAKHIYHKKYQEASAKDLTLFAGISEIDKVIKQFTDKQANIEVINLKNTLIFLASGAKIITALVTKKRLPNVRYFLKEITAKFEIFLGNYLQYYDSYETGISEPIERLVQEIVKF